MGDNYLHRHAKGLAALIVAGLLILALSIGSNAWGGNNWVTEHFIPSGTGASVHNGGSQSRSAADQRHGDVVDSGGGSADGGSAGGGSAGGSTSISVGFEKAAASPVTVSQAAAGDSSTITATETVTATPTPPAAVAVPIVVPGQNTTTTTTTTETVAKDDVSWTVSAEQWYLNDTAIVDPSTVQIVPGDVLDAVTTVTISTAGTNVPVQMVATPGTLIGDTSTGDTLQVANSVVLPDKTPKDLSSTPATLTVSNGQSLKLHVKVTFPQGTTGTIAQNSSVKLSDSTFTMTPAGT